MLNLLEGTSTLKKLFIANFPKIQRVADSAGLLAGSQYPHNGV
jgi:hypothetical protein